MINFQEVKKLKEELFNMVSGPSDLRIHPDEKGYCIQGNFTINGVPLELTTTGPTPADALRSLKSLLQMALTPMATPAKPVRKPVRKLNPAQAEKRKADLAEEIRTLLKNPDAFIRTFRFHGYDVLKDSTGIGVYHAEVLRGSHAALGKTEIQALKALRARIKAFRTP